MAASEPNELDLLTRFVCLGSETGSINVLSKREFSPDDASSVHAIISHNRGPDAVKRLKSISQQKCYVKKDCMLYALARIIREATPQSQGNHKGDSLRKEAYTLVQELCDSSSNLFKFIHYDKQVASPPKASWGRGVRKLITKWYNSRSSLDLAREATACKSAHGWSHKDLLCQVHFNSKSKSSGYATVLGYLLKGKVEKVEGEQAQEEEDQADKEAVAVIEAVERLKASQDLEREVIRSLIETNVLLGRQIPTHFYRIREAYEGQIGHMPLADLIRAVPKLAELGMLEPISPVIGRILERICNEEQIKEEKISPVAIFIALRKYDQNRAKRWTRNPFVVRSLHQAYAASLETVPKIGKRIMLAINLDAKIMKSHVSGANCLTCMMPCAIVAQMLTHTEDDLCVTYFNSTKTTELKLTKDMNTVTVIDHIVNETKDQGNQIFDLADGLQWAKVEQKPFDCMLFMSDKKAVSSPENFHAAVASYRSTCNVPDAKIAIVGLNDPTPLGNQNDLNFFDVTGFNVEVPQLLHNFFKGMPSEAV